MKLTLAFPGGREVNCDTLSGGVIAIHAPLGERKGVMLTYIPTMQTIWTLDPPEARKRATRWRRELEACDDWPSGPKCRAAVERLRKVEM